MIDNLFKFGAWCGRKLHSRRTWLTNLMTLSGYLFWAVRVFPQKSDNSVDCDEKLEQKAAGVGVSCAEIYGRLFVARNEIKDIRNTGGSDGRGLIYSKKAFVHRKREQI